MKICKKWLAEQFEILREAGLIPAIARAAPMSNVTQLDVKMDRLAAQLKLHEDFSDEVWELIEKYQQQGFMDLLIRAAIMDMAMEMQIGTVATIEGLEP
jgi:hypothetical protein